MSVDKWAADCAAHVEKLLRDTEGGNMPAFPRITHSTAAEGYDSLKALARSGGITVKAGEKPKIDPEHGTRWATTHMGWYVMVYSTSEVLAEVAKRLPDFEHLKRTDNETLWVVSKMMPESKRSQLNK